MEQRYSGQRPGALLPFSDPSIAREFDWKARGKTAWQDASVNISLANIRAASDVLGKSSSFLFKLNIYKSLSGRSNKLTGQTV